MKLYNTLTRQKEEFIPRDGKVSVYACGPTVYNYIHIGNARPLCVFDVLRRYLEYRGLAVTFVQNFTDIDDKIIKRANEEGCESAQIAQRFTKEYWTDAQGLQVREATVHPKATEHIGEILAIIAGLIEKGYAYAVQGDVYFSTGRYKNYGKLSHQPLEDLEAGARIMVGELKKEPMDFALWKAAKPGEPFWDSPYGKGRPGWHIECSAMVMRYLGETADIHCGGQDLIFPHHENEIAQSECFSGKPFARFWLHNGYINVDNVKMSKSLHNFFTVRDVAAQYGYEPIRYFLIASHYRSPINYNQEIIEQCKASLARLKNCRDNLVFAGQNAAGTPMDGEAALFEQLLVHKAHFLAAMEDDLNTADALAAVFDLVRACNSSILGKAVSKTLCGQVLALFDELCGILGILNPEPDAETVPDAQIEALIAARIQARQEKNWAEADRIRDQIKGMGITLEDTPQGVKWTKQ